MGDMGKGIFHMRRVTTPEDVRRTWLVRNACADWFQPYGEGIALQDWSDYYTYWRARGQMHLWAACVDNKPIGFGILRWEADSERWYATLAILPEHRRRAYGAFTLLGLAGQASGEVWADVRSDNEASLALVRGQGWVEVAREGDQPDHLLRFVHRRGDTAIGLGVAPVPGVVGFRFDVDSLYVAGRPRGFGGACNDGTPGA